MNKKFEIALTESGEKKLNLKVAANVFVPTGTTTALIRGVSSFIKKPGRLLDLGCGIGVVGLGLRELGCTTPPLFASDLSSDAVEITRINCQDYDCPVDARVGSTFDPWKTATFDYIVDDVSGISDQVASLSTWFRGVPCSSGRDGLLLTAEIVEQSSEYLADGGKLFFPAISFSNVNALLELTKKKFKHVELLLHDEWPMPKDLYQHLDLLSQLEVEGNIVMEERFGMIVCYTDVYVAYN